MGEKRHVRRVKSVVRQPVTFCENCMPCQRMLEPPTMHTQCRSAKAPRFVYGAMWLLALVGSRRC